MLVSENETLKNNIIKWAEELGKDRTILLPLLQRVQKKYSSISPYAMQIIADLLDIHPVEVYSVVSFYSFLNDEPKGRFVIRLCRTISCEMSGRDRIARQLQNELGIAFGETTPDSRFTLEWTNCMGMCDLGPAMMVNDVVFTEMTPEKAHEIVERCRQTFSAFALQNKQEG
ncbi:NAD(P)H-dependent oxidoreductase subunit E [bacterium]|nr:NAD(P)H-dependent oxidoreductase subunit E [candidate division CSSED10-310 bacterium]